MTRRRSEAELREWREFLREHHPDLGGDPEVFKTAMAERQMRVRNDVSPAVSVTAYRSKGVKAALRRWVAAPHLRRRRGRPSYM